MHGIIYVITNIVSLFIAALQLMMMFRAILSWLPVDDDSDVANFLFAMTEPVIWPVRMLLDRFEALRGLPIDISFLVAFLLLGVLQSMLPGMI